MRDHRTPAEASLDDLLARWRRDGRPDDLAVLFDAAAPVLFRVALHLCPDAATAEDALQDTFIVVLERAHLWDPKRPAMPWLVGILRNQSLMARRRAARTPDPDRAPAPASPLDPALEAAEAEERERLREVLKDLPEPYRGVALLRWRYGLDPAAIAEVQGVPPGTVRSWLSRALARIKVSMAALPALLLVMKRERGLDGVRTAVLRRAAARLRPEPVKVVASGSVVVRALAGVPVGRALLAASAAILAVGSAGWYLFGVGDGSEAVDGQPSPVKTASAPAEPKAAEAAPPAPAAAAADAPKPAEEPFDGVEFEVLVRDAAGPVAGAEVALWRPATVTPRNPLRYFEEPAFPGEVETTPATSDANGVAVLRIPRSDLRAQEMMPVFSLYAARGDEAAFSRIPPFPKSGRRKWQIMLSPAARHSGSVRWHAGGVVPGALVYIRLTMGGEFVVVRADGGGRYRSPPLPLSACNGEFLLARAAGALEGEWRKVAEPGAPPDAPATAPIDKEIVLYPQWTLRGRCVDGSGRPIENLSLSVDVRESLTDRADRRGVTSADGTFSLDGMDGKFSRLLVDGGERGLLVVNFLGGNRAEVYDLGDLVFAGTKDLRGIVLRDDGSPVSGAVVLLVPTAAAFKSILARTRTDEEGSFRFVVADSGGKGYEAGEISSLAVRILHDMGEEELRALIAAFAGREEDALYHAAETRGIQRNPFLPSKSPERIFVGGYRARFRFLDAATGEPALVSGAKITLRHTVTGLGRSTGINAQAGREFAPALYVPTAGPCTVEVQVQGHDCDVPEVVEISAERETVVEVRVRKKP